MQNLFSIPFTSFSFSWLVVAWIISLMAAVLLLIALVLKDHFHGDQLEKINEEVKDAYRRFSSPEYGKEEHSLIISHQIRTPLSVIKGYASMLADGDYGRLSAAQLEAVDAIYKSSNNLISFASDVLDAAELENDEVKNLDMSDVNLKETVSKVLMDLKPKADKKNLYMYFDQINKDAPIVSGNEPKIRQAVTNIVDNAIKYTSSGGVTVRLIADVKGIRLSVTDTGIGVSSEDQRKLFDKFFRSPEASGLSIEGTGMGMYIAKKIAEAHGGTVWVESEGKGKGATFHMWLPISDDNKEYDAKIKKDTVRKIEVESKKPVLKKSSAAKTIKGKPMKRIVKTTKPSKKK